MSRFNTTNNVDGFVKDILFKFLCIYHAVVCAGSALLSASFLLLC